MMVNFHMAPYPRPEASFVEDNPQQQRHKGWQVLPLACARLLCLPWVLQQQHASAKLLLSKGHSLL